MNRIVIIGIAFLTSVFVSATSIDVELENKSLLDDRIELKIPKGFQIMPEKKVKAKYPSDRRPTLVYTNKTGAVNVALNLTQNRASQDVLLSYKKNFVQAFRKLYPSAQWKGHGVEEVNGRKIGYMELVTPLIDTEMYNLIFFTDIDEKLLLCTFNCTKKSIDEWEGVAKEIMESLKLK